MTSRFRRAGAALAAASLCAPAAAAGGSGHWIEDAPYAVGATAACLKQRGGVVGRVQPTNRGLRTLRDIAQKNSIQVRVRGVVVGLAFGNSTSAAALLSELLRDPNIQLQVDQLRNVVVLSPRSAVAVRSTVFGCLRT
jgi:hypothetical protein